MILVGGICILLPLAFILWMCDIVQKWQDKRYPKQKKMPLSINDHRFKKIFE